MSKPNWEEIRREWETTNITFKDLAEKHNVKLGTLKSRRSREKWSRDATKPKKEKVATLKQKDASIENKNKRKEIDIKEPIVESDELTDRQRLFCIYYLKSFNATQSAIKAGYSPDTAHVQGSRLLSNAKVSKEIQRLKKEMQQEVFISAMDVLNKYIKIAFADITDYVSFGKKEIEVVNDLGEVEEREINFVDFKDSAVVDGTIITEVRQGRDGVSIKLADKMRALEKLEKYFDLFPDKFKRKIEEEKLKIAQAKVFGLDDEEYEDDGFLDAIKSTVDIWDDENG